MHHAGTQRPFPEFGLTLTQPFVSQNISQPCASRRRNASIAELNILQASRLRQHLDVGVRPLRFTNEASTCDQNRQCAILSRCTFVAVSCQLLRPVHCSGHQLVPSIVGKSRFPRACFDRIRQGGTRAEEATFVNQLRHGSVVFLSRTLSLAHPAPKQKPACELPATVSCTFAKFVLAGETR